MALKINNLNARFDASANIFGKLKPVAMLFSSALLLAGMPSYSAAVTLFDSNVAISGQAEFDSLGDPSLANNASQTGYLTRTLAGVDTTSKLNNATVTGDDPLSGNLTAIGDGFKLGFTASGSSDNAESESFPLFGDYQIAMQNNSLVDTFIISLRLDFEHWVNASGNDAFGSSQILLKQADATELMFSRLLSDTVNANEVLKASDNSNNVGTGAGGLLSDNGFFIFSFELAPGAAMGLGDSSPELAIFGGAIDGTFNLTSNVSISVASVEKKISLNNEVPEPETLMLLMLGLLSMRIGSQRKILV